MNAPSPRVLLFLFYFVGHWIGGAALPAIAGQSSQTPVNASTENTFEGGVLLKTVSQKIPIPAPLLNTKVRMTVSGLIARTRVEQQFNNPSQEWAEGVYVFPLPAQAAVDHLRMKIGDRTIEGQIQEREKAKKTYAKAKAKGQRASLVEQERPNIFTTSVANIAPHALITIEIEYQEIVKYDQGQFSLRFPMVVGPRYIPGQPTDILTSSTPTSLGWAPNTNQVPDASRITPPVQHPSRGPINPISLQIDLAPGMLLQQIESPTHPISIMKQETNFYQVSLQERPTYADRDFELIWTPLSHDTPQASVFTEEHEGETYLFLQLMPPTATTSIENHSLPREMIFVIDTSGSMAGKSLTEAKAALVLALSRLKPQDTFNLIQFNSTTHSLYSTARSASDSRIHEAQRYVNRLQASGGTEMLPALTEALSHQPDSAESHRLRQIIFITDGLVGNEDSFFRLLQQELYNSRLFTVGIGSAPNGHFMGKAAHFGKGTFTYIGSTTEVQDKMNRLFRKLEHPALTDISIQFKDSQLNDMLPNPLPDLYAGEPLTVAFRTTTLPSTITITGKQADTHWETTQSLEDAKPRSGITVHWARQKIAQLMDQQTQKDDKAFLQQSIVDLALKHHLVSRYTSLVAVDITPVRPDAQTLNTHALKTHLPHGMQYEAIFGWPQTATPARFYLVLGSLILGVTWMFLRQHAQR